MKNYDLNIDDYLWHKPITYDPVLQLDSDLKTAMAKMQEIQKVEEQLPGIDCSACGSPSCHAFAVDVVQGTAKMSDCLIILKNRLKDIME